MHRVWANKCGLAWDLFINLMRKMTEYESQCLNCMLLSISLFIPVFCNKVTVVGEKKLQRCCSESVNFAFVSPERGQPGGSRSNVHIGKCMHPAQAHTHTHNHAQDIVTLSAAQWRCLHFFFCIFQQPGLGVCFLNFIML